MRLVSLINPWLPFTMMSLEFLQMERAVEKAFEVLNAKFFKKITKNTRESFTKVIKNLLKIEMIVTQDMMAPSIVYSMLFAINKIKVSPFERRLNSHGKQRGYPNGEINLKGAQQRLVKEFFHINPIFMADFVWIFELDQNPGFVQKAQEEVEFLVRKSVEKNRFTRAIALVIGYSLKWPQIDMLIEDIIRLKDKYEVCSLICIEKQKPEIRTSIVHFAKKESLLKNYNKWEKEIDDEIEKNIGKCALVLFQEKNQKGISGDKNKVKKPKKHVAIGGVIVKEDDPKEAKSPTKKEEAETKPKKEEPEPEEEATKETKKERKPRRNEAPKPNEAREPKKTEKGKEKNGDKVPAATKKACRKQPWEKVEELFSYSPVKKLIGAAQFYLEKQENPKFLVCLAKLLARNKEVLEALRPNLTKEQLDLVQTHQNAENLIYSRDFFGPLEVINKADGSSELLDENFLTLKEFGVSKESVVFVDKLLPGIREEIMAQKTVGIDTESVINFTMPQKKRKGLRFGQNELALIQIALSNQKVFLFDVLALRNEKEFSHLIEDLLKSKDIQKLFFDGDGDLSEMGDALKIKDLRLAAANVTDLKIRGGGLKKLVETQLKRNICKFEQKSAWNTRPLRQSQLHYAAMDAVVLLEILKAAPLSVEDQKKPRQSKRPRDGANPIWTKKK